MSNTRFNLEGDDAKKVEDVLFDMGLDPVKRVGPLEVVVELDSEDTETIADLKESCNDFDVKIKEETP